ncbi:MAG: hypothetical protein A3E88_05700 [Legionellales bacterium RIFCSPHIGHO2_12_FULL_35_11]|nr:MAG: hypothetical protein A3E88_05700 [Legionellales bacterium RIFCSPHIGHO2_12_FULL_35_11]
MFITNKVEEISKKLFEILPDSVQNLDTEIKQQFHDILHYAFNKLDLVTREEFDVQVKVLVRTREKVEQLEQEIKKV